MKKINHSVLIVSVASAMFILGISVVLGLHYGVAPGLLTGVGAFSVLITCMLFINRHMSRKAKKAEKKKEENPDNKS